MAVAKPQPPPVQELAKGGHILVLCLGQKNEIRITPIMRTLRMHSDLPLVVL